MEIDNVIKIGVVVNPIAGMGGRVGLKGTDGVVDEAIRRGAKPIAAKKMSEALAHFAKIAHDDVKRGLIWLTCGGDMGARSFEMAELSPFEIVYNPQGNRTSAEDTKSACKAFIERGVSLIVFCGGDGTARDVHASVTNTVPILGIPSGVKMHSGVFAINPIRGAEIILEFVLGRLETQECEIMDLDEDLYRRGEWNLKIYGIAIAPYEPSYIQSGKMMVEALDDEEVKIGICNYIIEDMDENPDCLYILGPGSTMNFIGHRMSINKTLLGVDCVVNKQLVARDVDEKTLLNILDKYPCAKIVVSPIGAQGFIFGRGNLQISAEVVKKVGINNILVVATPAKLQNTPVLRVDFDDPEVVDKFKTKKYLFVISGYHIKVMRRIEI